MLLVATVQSHIGQFHKPLMRMLREESWEIHVAARNNLDEKDGLQLEYPDKVFDVPFQRSPTDRRNIKAYRQLKAILAENQYDVVHCNTPVGGILTRLAAKKYRGSGTQVYYTAHGFHFYKGAPFKNWLLYYPLEKCFAHWTDKLITINQEDYALAKKHFACPVEHIHGVGANSKRYFPISRERYLELRKELGLDGTVILTAGELLPNKNHAAAIRALSKVKQSIPDARLLIAGNGPERDRLIQLVRELNLQDSVSFLGYTMNLPQYMQACDIFVSCSFREGMPLNVIEAMLCGQSVIASDNRGHRELIQIGENGFLVSLKRNDELYHAILKALEMSERQKELIPGLVHLYQDTSVQKELKAIYGAGETPA